ncbi:hypothetical protein E2C01_070639 [Portunus trituberculatus]|uniref:Uncharacterized protein n=1 Tax=Portunus trituberculatus TaxID=210409 RepID=A0A5B7HXU2_PORTR|nr:hypothetical protein [Portunus trituberculatus]
MKRLKAQRKKLAVKVKGMARKAPVGILEEYMWEALFSFRTLVAQAILLTVVPILGPISPPKRIFVVTTWNLGIMVTCR